MRIMRLFTLVLISLAAVSAQARQPIYFSVYGGGTSFDTAYEFAGPLDLNLEDDGNTFGFGVGYEVTDRWIAELDYTYTNADDVTIEQIFLSLNYKYPLPMKGMHAMAGILVAEGFLDWDSTPDLATNLNSDTDAAQSALGIQFGFIYELDESWSTTLKYQYFDQEFKTHVNTDDFGRANFHHEEFQYILFGVGYHF
jgi:opacity protein-like surface antigen